MPPGMTVTVRHDGHWIQELPRKNYDIIHYSVHTFDSNMVERVKDGHVIQGPYYDGQPDPPVYYDDGTTIESSTFPEPIELVYTNSYPPTVKLSGQSVTNMTFRDIITSYRPVVSNEWKYNSYVFEVDHTRDFEERFLIGTVFSGYWEPADTVISNSTTTVELTVTNSLPEDAIEYHADYIEYKADVEYVLIVDKENKVSLYRHWTNPLTGEEFWKQQDQPFPIGNYFYECNLLVPGKLETSVGPEFDPCDESIFFRVMTQVDWLWNFMRIDK